MGLYVMKENRVVKQQSEGWGPFIKFSLRSLSLHVCACVHTSVFHIVEEFGRYSIPLLTLLGAEFRHVAWTEQ